MIRSIFFTATILFVVAACTSQKEKTPAGFEYVHHVKNEGETPQIGEYVYFHMVQSIGDSIFGDSRNDPQMPILRMPAAEELEGQKPHPLFEIFPLMAEGDSVTVYYPLDSLEGQRPPGFENSDFLVLDVILNEIKTDEEYQEAFKAEQEAYQARMEANQARLGEVQTQTEAILKDFKDGKLADQLQTTDSGLQYLILEEGTGPVAKLGQKVSAHYLGMLMDGTVFDSSLSRGDELVFPVGMRQVIKGWDEAFTALKEGTKAVLFIPSDLAYGENGQGPIAPNSDLVFYVELNEVQE